MRAIAGLLSGVILALLFGLEAGPDRPMRRGLLVERVLDVVERTHVKPIDGDQLLHEGLDRMLRSLDRNSCYFSPSEVAAFDQDTEGYIEGIGVVVGGNEPGDPPGERLPRITLVVDGSPAARAGLRAGERIRSAAGESLRDRPVEEATQLIKGREGTTVALEIEDPEGKVRTVVVERRRVTIPSVGDVALFRVPGGEPVGLVRLRQFQPRSTEEVRGALEALIDRGARSVVLDLRENGGGLLDEAIGVASLFIGGRREIVHTAGRGAAPPGGGVPQVLEESALAGADAPFPDLPMAVLIDGNSASASEIVAAALRDHGRAPLIGEESYGKWTVQDVISLGPDARDGKVKITTQSFHPPNGQRIRRAEDGPHGLIPDVPVTVDPEQRALLRAWWGARRYDRMNAPLAVDDSTVPLASAPRTELPPADPILARAVDLMSRPGQVASLFADGPAAVPPDPAPNGERER